MTSPAAPFTEAMEAALRASTALRTAMGNKMIVLREVPTNQLVPYVVIGQDEIEDLSDEDCGDAHSIISTVQWWTKINGSVKGAAAARQMGAAIIDAIFKDLNIAGHDTVLVAMELSERYGTDPDQSSRGSVAFRYEVQAV